MNQNLLVTLLLSAIVGVIVYYLCKDIGNDAYEEGYKDGMIKAMKENDYVLVEFEDGGREYRKKSELKDLVAHKVVEK